MSVLSVTEVCSSPRSGVDLIGALLREQQQMTAVEQFARCHDRDELPAQARYYRDLIPLALPQAGEQYAFEVDLDACSGCKACVVACHNLNGLEDDEAWRGVGLLTGGTNLLPIVQHVTTACHHCLDPACLEGCPVNAYVKDPLTGIVRHLDDQCIGCQYCILKCPYDVPKYSAAKGIVRKCDMCRDRLAVDEAPACVQACPNRAIRITVVNRQTVREESETDQFIPGAAEPSYTLPTTVYKTRRPLPRNLLPADYYVATPQHAHWPLVLMLVLTQMSVGAFWMQQMLDGWLTSHGPHAAGGSGPAQSMAAFGLGLLGLGASLFHLGRPWYAYRAVLGLWTSWLSREILCFSAFAGLASLYAAYPWLPLLGAANHPRSHNILGWSVVASGLAGVFCSVMVYHSTRRPLWHGARSAARFFLTCVVLGLPTSLLLSLCGSYGSAAPGVRQIMSDYGADLCGALVVAAGIKLLFEACIFTHLFGKQLTPLKRTAALMRGDLARATVRRFTLGCVGGLLLPGLLYSTSRVGSDATHSSATIVAVVTAVLVLTLLGEILERYLFFAAVIAPRMPGIPAA